MRILILNWRCPRNPRAGGAELVTFEVARRFVQWGHSVEWFAATYAGASPEEDIEGVRILRSGRQWTVHWHAFRRYRRRLRANFDAVIDEVNTIPFFTGLWADVPRFMLIHQLAREVWWYESPFPFSALGFLLEPIYLRLYRNFPVLTVSVSTQQDLIKMGFIGPITIVPEGIEPITEVSRLKAANPTFLYVGRLAPSKRVNDIVLAFARFHESFASGQLWLVGTGSVKYTRRLIALVDKLDIGPNVRFFGHVPAEEKHRLMAAAHGLVMASTREGWGLVVTEANACGTPAVVYDVPGLRDAVRHEKTGLVVKVSPAALAGGMTRLISDPELYRRLAIGASKWSREFSFDKSAAAIGKVLNCVPAP